MIEPKRRRVTRRELQAALHRFRLGGGTVQKLPDELHGMTQHVGGEFSGIEVAEAPIAVPEGFLHA